MTTRSTLERPIAPIETYALKPCNTRRSSWPSGHASSLTRKREVPRSYGKERSPSPDLRPKDIAACFEPGLKRIAARAPRVGTRQDRVEPLRFGKIDD